MKRVVLILVLVICSLFVVALGTNRFNRKAPESSSTENIEIEIKGLSTGS